jgi:hypothetical protein
MESKVSFIYPTGIKVNKLVKIKDEILPKTKGTKKFATKAVKNNLFCKRRIKINQPK